MNKIFNTKIWLLILAAVHTVMGIIVNYQAKLLMLLILMHLILKI